MGSESGVSKLAKRILEGELSDAKNPFDELNSRIKEWSLYIPACGLSWL